MLYIRRIVGESMLPAYKPGQVVLFMKSKRCSINDVVLLNHAGIEKIKRIANFEKDSVFVTGDNLSASTDSRHFGFVPKQNIRARLIISL